MEKLINKIIHGDCFDILPTIPNESIDLILIDPPYNLTACKWDKEINFKKLFKEFKRIIKSNRAIAIFGSEPFSSSLRIENIDIYKYDWIWHKNLGGTFALVKKQPLKRHENISIFYNKQCIYNPQFEEYSNTTKKRFKSGEFMNRNTANITNSIHGGMNYPGIEPINFERGTYPTSVKFFKRPHTANNNSLHPTQKPVELFKYLIKTYTNENQLVLDCFTGSGTTAIACMDTSRNFIAIEKDEEYFNIASNRIEAFEEKVNQHGQKYRFI